MKIKWSYLYVVFLIASCGREFSSPPPTPKIESLTPAEGFMGDLVTIRGINFAKNSQDNLVFFGTESARIQSGSESELVVEVPALEVGESVHVKVSTTLGQGTSPDPFRYTGPGHPVAERLDHVIQVEWAPLAVTSIFAPADLTDEPSVVVANYTGRTASLVGTWSGAHLDFGVGTTPISVALAHNQGVTAAYLTTAEIDPDRDPLLQSRLDVVTISTADQTRYPQFQLDSFDSLPSVDGSPFQPGRVWSYCKTLNAVSQQCDETGVVVSDMHRPILALLTPGRDLPDGILQLDNAGCMTPERSEAVVDLRYDRQGNRFLATLEKGPEIWSIPLTGCPSRLWPAAGFAEDPAAWIRRFSALAVYRNASTGRAFLYAADVTGETLIEFEFADELDNPTDDSLTARRAAPLMSAPFAITTARMDADLDRIYVACEDGIAMFSPDTQATGLADQLLMEGMIPLAYSRGGPQSLGIIRYAQDPAEPFWPDEVMFTDTARDVLRVFPAGEEYTDARDLPLGASWPRVATSRFSNTLYLTDPVANMIRLIDRDSGIQTDQFPIFDALAFGATNVACLDAGDADILLIPLPLLSTDRDGFRMPYDRIVVRRAGGTEDIQRWLDDGYDNQNDQGIYSESMLQGTVFHEMLPAPQTRALYLVRYSKGIGPGRLWSFEFFADAPTTDCILLDEEEKERGPLFDFIDVELDPSVEMVRLSHNEETLVLLDAPNDQPARLLSVPLADPGSASEIILDDTLSHLVSEMAVLTGDARTTYYLTLPQLGQVAAVSHDGRVSFIETSGAPARLFFSPDGRRLYVAHNGVGKLSVIDTGCDERPGCERVLQNIEVQPHPGDVVFHPSGKSAFLTHYMNNTISVIE